MDDKRRKQEIEQAVLPFLTAGSMPLGVKTGYSEYMVGVSGHYFHVGDDGEVHVEEAEKLTEREVRKARRTSTTRVTVIEKVLGLTTGPGYRWFLGRMSPDIEERIKRLGLPEIVYRMQYEGEISIATQKMLEAERVADLAWFQVPVLEYTPILLQEIARRMKQACTQADARKAVAAALKAVDAQPWSMKNAMTPHMVLPFGMFPEQVWPELRIKHKTPQEPPVDREEHRIIIPEFGGSLHGTD